MKLKNIQCAMRVCEAVSIDSSDKKTQVGSVLIRKDSGVIVNTGFNGFIRGAPDDKLPAYNDDKHEFMIHSEMNLMANCIREGISVKDCIVVCTHSPCVDCTRFLWQCGITKVICKHMHKTFKKVLIMEDLSVDISANNEFTVIEYSRR